MNDSSLEIRPAPWWLFVLLLAVSTVMGVLANQWYVPSGVWKPVHLHSHGLLDPALIWGVLYFLVVICGVLLGVGRRRPTEFGVEWRKLPAAALYTCVLWIVAQVVLGACSMGFGDPLAIADGWKGVGILEKVGALLGQFLGNALCEEIVFRGFLLMQCVLLFRARWPHRPRTAFVLSLWVATAIFAVSHVPYHLRPDNYVSLSNLALNQVGVFIFGCFIGWVYWQTRNLFFAVGVHSLLNDPTTLLAWHDDGQPVVVVGLVGLGIAAVWHRLPAIHQRPAS